MVFRTPPLAVTALRLLDKQRLVWAIAVALVLSTEPQPKPLAMLQIKGMRRQQQRRH